MTGCSASSPPGPRPAWYPPAAARLNRLTRTSSVTSQEPIPPLRPPADGKRSAGGCRGNRLAAGTWTRDHGVVSWRPRL